MARAKELAANSQRINVRVDAEAARMLSEMVATWYPGKTRLQGAVVSRAIRLLYKQFQREQKGEAR